jgi:hypothetical protein
MTINPNQYPQWFHNPQNFGFILDAVNKADHAFYLDNTEYIEVEHQAGRYLNMKSIVKEIVDNNVPGDVVEFGTYQGLGLLMMAQCFPADQTRRFVGIDSFEGLPESSNGWVKGSFNDASLDAVKMAIGQHWPDGPDLQGFLIQGWFNDPTVAQQLQDVTQSVAMVHFDADLGSSTQQALSVIEPYLTNRKEPIYFLFDDWGIHPDEVPAAWQRWLDAAQTKFNFTAEEISNTKLTKNFRLTFAQ